MMMTLTVSLIVGAGAFYNESEYHQYESLSSLRALQGRRADPPAFVKTFLDCKRPCEEFIVVVPSSPPAAPEPPQQPDGFECSKSVVEYGECLKKCKDEISDQGFKAHVSKEENKRCSLNHTYPFDATCESFDCGLWEQAVGVADVTIDGDDKLFSEGSKAGEQCGEQHLKGVSSRETYCAAVEEYSQCLQDKAQPSLQQIANPEMKKSIAGHHSTLCRDCAKEGIDCENVNF